jgi:hypothetical protein
MFKPNLILTMAGGSNRFRQAGIESPKWMLNVDGKSLLYWALLPMLDKVNSIIFVALKAHKARQLITEICSELKISNYEVIELPKVLAGQALSARVATRVLPAMNSIIIWNIDTILRPKLKDFSSLGNLPWMGLSELQGDNWSFAEISNNLVTNVAEKKRISKWASIGMYGFPSAESFKSALSWYTEKNHSETEIYVAPLYHYWIDKNSPVIPYYYDVEEILPAGTPKDMIYCHEKGLYSLDLSLYEKLKMSI